MAKPKKAGTEPKQAEGLAVFRCQREKLVIQMKEDLFRKMEKFCCENHDTDISVRSPSDPYQAEMVNLRCAMGSVDGADVDWDEFGVVSAKCELVDGRAILEMPTRLLFEKVRQWVAEDKDVAIELEGEPGPRQAEMVNLRCASSTLRDSVPSLPDAMHQIPSAGTDN